MTELKFSITDARPEPYAAGPTMLFRLRLDEMSGEPVHAIVLRCQIQIEPRQRRYNSNEEPKLFEIFAEPARWGDTLLPLLWAHVSATVPAFRSSTEIDLPVACSYDFEVAAAKYFDALEQGEIPLLFLFSGTVFTRGTTGFSVEPISWTSEAPYRLPVQLWREAMDRYFPGTAWLRLRRESFDALYRYRCSRALPSWDAAIDTLLSEIAAEKWP
jgi:hypothetical protein